MKDKFFVYYYTNNNDDVLYVGITNNIHTRNRNHSQTKWYPDAVKLHFYDFGNIVDQTIYEIYLINKLKGENNIKHQFNTVPNLEIESPSFTTVKPTELVQQPASKEPKVKKTNVDTSTKVNRNIKYEDIMWADGPVIDKDDLKGNLKVDTGSNLTIEEKYNMLNQFYYDCHKVLYNNEYFFFYVKCDKHIETFWKKFLLNFSYSSPESGSGTFNITNSAASFEDGIIFTLSMESLLELEEQISNITVFYNNLPNITKLEGEFHRSFDNMLPSEILSTHFSGLNSRVKEGVSL